MQACNFPKQSDRVECRCSQAGIVQREPEFSFDRDSELLVRIPFHHESSVPEVPSASVGPDHRGRNSAGHRHAGHYPRHHGARGAEKGTQLESITSWGEIRCRFIFSGKNDEPTPDFPDTGFPLTRMMNRHRISRLRLHALATASGSFAATLNKARAGPSGAFRPCSQFWRVETLTPIKRANSD